MGETIIDPITTTMLLSSIDHTLASVRAVLAAGEDPEQTERPGRSWAGRRQRTRPG